MLILGYTKLKLRLCLAFCCRLRELSVEKLINTTTKMLIGDANYKQRRFMSLNRLSLKV